MTFPDVIALTRAYITPLVAPVNVVSRVPDPRPAQLVQVRRVGGLAEVPVRDQARMDFFSWDTTDQTSMNRALTIRSAIWALKGNDILGVMVYDIEEFLGPRLDDDPITHSPRTWMTLQLTVRADDVTPAPAS